MSINNLTVGVCGRSIEAHKQVANAMARVIPIFWNPLSGFLCNSYEKEMISEICMIFEIKNESLRDGFYSEFRKNFRFLNFLTYAPYAGLALQFIEIYAIGRYVTMYIERYGDDFSGFSEKTRSILSDNDAYFFSADMAISFYEEAKSESIPEDIKDYLVVFFNGVGAVLVSLEENVVSVALKNKINATEEMVSDGVNKLFNVIKSKLS